MDKEAIDFRTMLAAWADAEKGASGGHPSARELSDYRTGRLAAADQRRVADHVVLCRQCFDALPDLAAFEEAAADRDSVPADFEAAAFWRTLQPRLEDLRDAEAPEVAERAAAGRVSQEEPRRRAAAGYRRWGVPAALAVSLVAAVLGWTAWTQHRTVKEHEQTIAEFRAPRPNVEIYDLFEDTSVRSGAVSSESVEASEPATLILTPQDPGAFADYEVRILDGSEELKWSRRGFRKDPEDETFSLLLPPGFLTPGEYRVQLWGLEAGEEARLIEEYVVQSKP